MELTKENLERYIYRNDLTQMAEIFKRPIATILRSLRDHKLLAPGLSSPVKKRRKPNVRIFDKMSEDQVKAIIENNTREDVLKELDISNASLVRLCRRFGVRATDMLERGKYPRKKKEISNISIKSDPALEPLPKPIWPTGEDLVRDAIIKSEGAAPNIAKADRFYRTLPKENKNPLEGIKVEFEKLEYKEKMTVLGFTAAAILVILGLIFRRK